MRHPDCDIIAAVLAGGASSRMGQPKHAMLLDDGRTLIEHVIEALHEVCGRVVIVGQIDLQRARDLEVIHDLRPGLGPLGGIEALLASGIAPQYLICPCDVPLITAGSLRDLVMNTNGLATVFRHESARDFDPLPARISARALPIASRLLDEGRRGVHELMRELGAHEVSLPQDREAELMNVNTPADFDAARRRLALTRGDRPSPPSPQRPHPARS